jgi:UDP-N-acetylglucosamine:LPS N-acetylglucosamine transferase
MGKGVEVYVSCFVNNMDEWMKVSDALVTKAGPGTIAEAHFRSTAAHFRICTSVASLPVW